MGKMKFRPIFCTLMVLFMMIFMAACGQQNAATTDQEETPEVTPEVADTETDILVIGGGAAGLTAAYYAKEQD